MTTGTIRVAVVDMQPITPAVGGGRLRLLGLYHALGEGFDTTYIGTYDWPGECKRELQLTDTLREIDVPLSTEHFRRDAQWRDWAGGSTIIDTAFPIIGRLSEEFLARAEQVIRTSDVVVISHPWAHPLLEGAIDRRRQLLVYDSHNAEGLLRYEILGHTAFGREIAKCAAATEAFLARDAEVVVACSTDDLDFYHQACGVPRNRLVLVPNGVFVKSITAPSAADRAAAKRDLGIPGHAAIFIGSNYGPNVIAAKYIAEVIAPLLPHVTFLICGGVGHKGELRSGASSNLRYTGRISDEERLRLLHAADVAVNPMFSGSGTNIKMFDFMAAGLPVVSTATGARGICGSNTHGIWVSEPERIADRLDSLLRASSSLDLDLLGRANRKWVEQDFAWESLSPRLGEIIRLALDARNAAGFPCVANVLKPTPPAEFGGQRTVFNRARSDDRVAILSTLGIRCGIAEHSSNLAEAMLKSGADVTVLANTLEGHAGSLVPLASGLRGAHVERVWQYDNVTWSRSAVPTAEVLRLLQSRNIRHLNVQYHPGFFPEATLVDLLRAVQSHGLFASASLHNSSLASPAFVDSLAELSIPVFVHRPAERDRLRKAGVRMTEWLPLGVRDTLSAMDGDMPFTVRDGIPVIATFGFLRPHKGLMELVEAASILREVFSGLCLFAQTALYPSADSAACLKAVTERIAQLGLEDAVHLDPSFVDIDLAIARLARTDVVVLPYSASDEGASGAAATALAARRPIVTTQARIFDELRGVAYMAEDSSPEVLAAAIASVLAVPGLRKYLRGRAKGFADLRSWNNVASKMLASITGVSFAADPGTSMDRIPGVIRTASS